MRDAMRFGRVIKSGSLSLFLLFYWTPLYIRSIRTGLFSFSLFSYSFTVSPWPPYFSNKWEEQSQQQVTLRVYPKTKRKEIKSKEEAEQELLWLLHIKKLSITRWACPSSIIESDWNRLPLRGKPMRVLHPLTVDSYCSFLCFLNKLKSVRPYTTADPSVGCVLYILHETL